MIAFTGFMSTLTLLLGVDRAPGRQLTDSKTADLVDETRCRCGSSRPDRRSKVRTAALGVKHERNLGTGRCVGRVGTWLRPIKMPNLARILLLKWT